VPGCRNLRYYILGFAEEIFPVELYGATMETPGWGWD